MPVICLRARSRARDPRDAKLDVYVNYDNFNSRRRAVVGENQMEKFDIVDLIRAMAKKCEDLESAQNQVEMYKRWWKEEKEVVKELQAKLNNTAI